MTGNMSDSGLARIDFSGSNPFQLFKEWYEQVQKSELVHPDALCFSTCSKEGKPSSRHLLLRRLDDNGFVVMTDGRSKKAQELAENQNVSVAFLWCFRKENQTILRQVRIEGHVEEMPQSACHEIWEGEPLYCKIRANVCNQGQPVDWEEHKRNYDSLYQDVITTKQVPTLPSHVGHLLRKKRLDIRNFRRFTKN